MSRPCEACHDFPATELVYSDALCRACAKLARILIKERGLGIPKTIEAAPEVFNLALVDARAERVEAIPEPVSFQPSLFEV